MAKSHLNILIPQWQGGGPDLSAYKGGQHLKSHYLKDVDFKEVEVRTDDLGEIKNNIAGYDEICEYLSRTKSLIDAQNPKTIFTIGGGCDVDIAQISYLNKAAGGDMTLLYFDAHGDLNTPESSPSKYFFGMPLRTLLGDGDKNIIASLYSTLLPSQVIMFGVRDLDKPESEYIRKSDLRLLPVDEIEKDISRVIGAAKEAGRDKIYIHIDLDVLDPGEFPYSAIPVPGGLKNNTLARVLRDLNDEFEIIGLGLLEYSSSEDNENKLLKEIINIGADLE